MMETYSQVVINLTVGFTMLFDVEANSKPVLDKMTENK